MMIVLGRSGLEVVLSSKRQVDILNAVRAKGSCRIVELASQLDVSTETIRRNIKPLVSSGKLISFHGGIMAPDHVEEPPFQRRMLLNRSEKRKIAKLITNIIKDDDSLILDNGTTTTYIAEALALRAGLTIVTNSAEIACRLTARNGNRVIITGGELSGETAAAYGPSTIEFIQQFEVKYAFVSVGGVNNNGELVDFTLHEAEFSRAAIKQAQEVWVVADRSKFGRNAPIRICKLSDVDVIVCDEDPPTEFQRRCEEAEVRILTPANWSLADMEINSEQKTGEV